MSTDFLTLYKLMILYILNSLEFPPTNSQLSEFFVKSHYTTYFHFQQAISELEASEFIRGEILRNTTSYYITRAGIKVLSAFDSRISKGIKEDIHNYFSEQNYLLRRQTDITADYYLQKNGEYMVKTAIREKGNVLLEIGLNVITREQAIDVCDRWDQKCEQVYQYLIQTLVMNQENPARDDTEDAED